jgi:hypothetical protein
MRTDDKKPTKRLCEYCGRPPETPVCRVPDMHVQLLISEEATRASVSLHR